MTYQDDVRQNAKLSVQEQERQIAAANQNSAVARVVRISYFLFSALELILGVRVLLHALAANPNNLFANLIYQVSQPFVNVFASLLKNPQLGPGAVLEVTTIIAIFAYAVLAWLVAQVIWLAFSRPR